MAYDIGAGLAGLGASWGDAISGIRKVRQDEELGNLLGSGDYTGAAKSAFGAGDYKTGLSFLNAQQSKEAGPALAKALGGLYGGDPSSTAAPAFAGGRQAMTMPADPEIENRFIGTLKAGGLTNPNGLAAAAAYANAESGYSPENVTGSWSDPSQSGQPGTSGGILSWRADRLAAMKAATAGAADPVAAQAKFFLGENPEVTAALQNARSPEEAHAIMANAWKFAGYDQPGGESARRLEMTRSYLDRVGAAGSAPRPAPAAPMDASAPDPLGGDRPVATAMLPRTDGGWVPQPPARPADVGGAPGPVRTASADPSFAPQMPAAAAGQTPAQVLVSQARAREPAVAPALAPGVPASALSGGQAPVGAPVAQRAGAAAPAPAGDDDEGDAPHPAVVSAAAPQAIVNAGLPRPLAAAVAKTPEPNARIPILMRAMMIPGLSEGQQGLVKTLLTNELEQSKLPDDVKKYTYARAQDPSIGTFTQWTDRNQKGTDDTTDVKNFNAARTGGYTGTFTDFLTSVKRAGATNVTTNLDTKAETARDQEAGKALGQGISEDIRAGSAAPKKLQALAILDDAAKAGGDNIVGGPFGKAILGAKQGLAALGFDVSGTSESEVTQKIGFQLATEAARSITNRPSQMEFGKALENVPGLLMSAPGRRAMTSILAQQARQEAALGHLASNKKNWDDWEDVKSRFFDSHPIISPFTGKPFGQEDIEMLSKAAPKGGSQAVQAGGGQAPAGMPAPAALPAGVTPEAARAQAAEAIKSRKNKAGVLQQLKAWGLPTDGL